MSDEKPFSLVNSDGVTRANGLLPCGCREEMRELLRLNESKLRRQREGPWPRATHDPELSRDVNRHLGGYCGKWIGRVREKQSRIVSVEVFVYGPTEKHAYLDFFTAGMSQQPMNDPHARHTGLPDRAELMLQLPASWAGGEPVMDRLQREEHQWPVLLLQCLARLPHEREGYVDEGWMVHWEPDTLPGLPFDGVIFTDAGIDEHMAIGPMIRADLTGTSILQVVLLHESEIRFGEKHGDQALLRRLRSAGVDETVVVGREAVV